MQSLGDRYDAPVVGLVEVDEVMQPAAGEKTLFGAGGVAALHGRGEQRRQFRLTVPDQGGGDPARQDVAAGGLGAQDFGGLAAQLLVEIGDDLQVTHERAQLGRRPEVELGPLVDVERTVVVFRLEAQVIAILSALVEGQAVDDLPRIAAVEQAWCGEAHCLQGAPIREAVQGLGDAFLHRDVQRRLYGKIEPVEVVERGKAEVPEQAGAQSRGRLPGGG